MRLHPLFIIVLGLFFCSLGLNICMWETNKKLMYHIQKLETGQAKGLFLSPDEQNSKVLSEEEINELIREMFEKIQRERMI